MSLDLDRVRQVVRAALDEDLGRGDLTTNATVPEGQRAQGVLLAKQELVVAGLEVALTAFRLLDPATGWETEAHDGESNLVSSKTYVSPCRSWQIQLDRATVCRVEW